MDKTKKKPIRTGRSLSWEEREAMIKEYLQGGKTKTEVWRKYTGQDKENSQIIKWMRELGYLEDLPGKSGCKSRSIPKSASSKKKPSLSSTKVKEQCPEAALQQIQTLKKEIQDAQLKIEGYELMIDFAEKEFKIPIRKKSDTK